MKPPLIQIRALLQAFIEETSMVVTSEEVEKYLFHPVFEEQQVWTRLCAGSITPGEATLVFSSALFHLSHLLALAVDRANAEDPAHAPDTVRRGSAEQWTVFLGRLEKLFQEHRGPFGWALRVWSVMPGQPGRPMTYWFPNAEERAESLQKFHYNLREPVCPHEEPNLESLVAMPELDAGFPELIGRKNPVTPRKRK